MNKPPKPVSLAPVTAFSASDTPNNAANPAASVVKIHQPLQPDMKMSAQKSLDLSDEKSAAPAASAVSEPKASVQVTSGDKSMASSHQPGSTLTKTPPTAPMPVASTPEPVVAPVPVETASVAKPAVTKAVVASIAQPPSPVSEPKATPAPKARPAPKATPASKTVSAAKSAQAGPVDKIVAKPAVKTAAPARAQAPVVAPVMTKPVARVAPELKAVPAAKTKPAAAAVQAPKVAAKVATKPVVVPALPVMAPMFDIRSFLPVFKAASMTPPAFNGDIVKTMTSQMLNATRAFGDMQAALLDHAVTELKTGMGEIEACARSTTPSEVVVIQARAVRRSTEALSDTLKTISEKARKTLLPR